MAEVIRSTATQPHQPPKEHQVQQQLESVVASLVQTHGDDVSLLAHPERGQSNKAKMCQLTYDL